MQMKIDLLQLLTSHTDTISFEDNLSVEDALLKKAGILELKNIHVKGWIKKDASEQCSLSMTLDGTMILPCSVSLKPVSYPFHIEIEDDLLTLLQETSKNIEKLENTIDIFPIIWENILMEIPIKVKSDDLSDVQTEGEGWHLLMEDEEPQTKNLPFQDLLK